MTKVQTCYFWQIRANNYVVTTLILLKVYVLIDHWYIHNYVKCHESHLKNERVVIYPAKSIAFSLDFRWAFDNKTTSTIKYSMLLIIIVICFLYVCCCIAITKNLYLYEFVDHIQKLLGIEIGLFTPPTLIINKKTNYLFPIIFFKKKLASQTWIEICEKHKEKIKTSMPTQKWDLSLHQLPPNDETQYVTYIVLCQIAMWNGLQWTCYYLKQSMQYIISRCVVFLRAYAIIYQGGNLLIITTLKKHAQYAPYYLWKM